MDGDNLRILTVLIVRIGAGLFLGRLRWHMTGEVNRHLEQAVRYEDLEQVDLVDHGAP